MIKANELRIGNWVEYGGEYRQIESIHKEGGLGDNPIPLTPEILEKAGFVKDGFHSYNLVLPNLFQTSKGILCFSSDYLYLRQENNDKRHNDSICCLWNKDLMKTFYLHQLQNLFFSLTGEELTIKI